ncbi:hypothetical protein [Nocardia africana]|uniref:hypothetical protein n=1 Tax=Nocardia africana TaxID=134964 RepID=UPI0007A4988F|nr:hypothetical protein [Nocardia africana]MCC3313613.1 hypothetical protein [Nocardia africana]
MKRRKVAFASNSLGQSVAGGLVADCLGEILHVLIPEVGRERIDGNEVHLVEVDGRASIDAAVARPQHDLTGLRVDQPSALLVGLIRQSRGDLLQVEAAQVQHPAR